MPHLELVANHSVDSPEWRPAETQVGRVLEELCPTVVLWAIDVDAHSEENESIENLIDELTVNRNVVVEPVHVLLPESTPLPMRLFNKWSEELVYERAEKIRSYYQQSRLVRGPRILKIQEGSRNDGVDTLLEYADQIGADLIVAKSRKRNRLIRALRPGFTDELLERARIPVLLFDEESEPLEQAVSLHFPAMAA